MEYKNLPQFTKEIKDRTVIGIAAVHGVVDDGNDRSHPGSFASLSDGSRNRARFLWQHNGMEPPIATIDYVREVGRAELPQKVLSFAPEASGGVEISRTYLNSQRAGEVLEGIKAGAIDEMSYAYDVTHKDSTQEENRTIRELYGLKIFDFSDVNWGMNPATAGVKSWSGAALTFVEHSEAVGAIVEEYARRAKDRVDFRTKEGRVMSGAMRDRMARMMETMRQLADEMESIMTETTPPDMGKARALFIEYQRITAQLNGVTNYAN